MNALDKVINIIEAFLIDGDDLRLADLCRITGMNKSTAYVIAQKLVERGYLTQNGKGGSYFLSARFIELGNTVSHKLKVGDIALPYMTELNEEIDETVELCVRDGKYGAIISTVRANRLLSASGTGRWSARMTLHNTAYGKILAAYMNADEWEVIRDSLELVKDTPKTITDLDSLEKHLKMVRAKGVAVDDEETELGIRSVSAPIWDSNGVVIAGVCIIGPKLRIDRAKMTKYQTLIKECGLNISKAMGYVAG